MSPARGRSRGSPSDSRSRQVNRGRKKSHSTKGQTSVKLPPLDQPKLHCCDKSYTYSYQTLRCHRGDRSMTCGIEGIKPHEEYYNYKDKYFYCVHCFESIKEDSLVHVDEDPKILPFVIKKDEFVKLKNEKDIYEHIVACSECKRSFHEICVLHLEEMWRNGFVCDDCLKARKSRRKENVYTAKNLPQTNLGNCLENRVKSVLREKGVDHDNVIVRVMAFTKKSTNVMERMQRFLSVSTTNYPGYFPYNSKAIFVFQVQDGREVAIFGMYVQEYGQDCSEPNARSVYFAFLDSVHYFEPRNCRTLVYQEVILGYLKYMKELSYATAYIWACPPQAGSDYIFRCHPPEQKVPSVKRLGDWYKNLLDKGIQRKIVLKYKNIEDYSKERNWESILDIPYFEGDHWPKFIEDILKKMDEEESSQPPPSKKRKSSSKTTSPRKKKDLTCLLLQGIRSMKQTYFAVQLNPAEITSTVMKVDPDSTIPSTLMNDFVKLTTDYQYEFSSLRHTKFSTMAILYHVHKEFDYCCNICDVGTKKRYHCVQCENFDLCVKCAKDFGHEHEVIGFGFDDDELKCRNGVRNYMSPPSFMTILNHAYYCPNSDCSTTDCCKMKQVIVHLQKCMNKVNCPCRKMKAYLYHYHVKSCKNQHCKTALCTYVKFMLSCRRSIIAQKRNLSEVQQGS